MGLPLKWHGGKYYLAKRIVELMPAHLHYVEPFFGGGAVLLTRDPNDPRLMMGPKAPKNGVSEVANDVNGELINFWKVLQSADQFADFSRIVQAIPFAEVEWHEAAARQKNGDSRETARDPAVGRAVDFFVLCRLSLSGRMKSFTGITRTRTRRAMNNEVSAWLSTVEGLPAVHERLSQVMILNRKALEVIRSEDTANTLFYCDPPYLHETRVTTADYTHEMTREQHVELLTALNKCKGKVMLSGYASPLYADLLKDWKAHEFDLPNNAAGGEQKRRMTEVVWCNF
jgi:DNA adenine methylase